MQQHETANTAGLIVTAGRGTKRTVSRPLLKIGSISAVKRIVLTFQQAGIFPIVVVTGKDAEDVGHDLADYGVIFLRNSQQPATQMFDSAKIGLEYLRGKCRQIVFSPVDVPMFTPETLKKMMAANVEAIAPVYRGRSGHPLLISSALIPGLLSYQGNQGMRGALAANKVVRQRLEIDDQGILLDTDDVERLATMREQHNQQILHPFLRISIEKETLFFNARSKLLLMLLKETNSVRSACEHMALSYSKAWNMLNQLEAELGYAVVERKHGGSKGGKTKLTVRGEEFLAKFCLFEDSVRNYAAAEFARLF